MIRSTKSLMRLGLALVALTTTGCQTEITALTTPPPGYVGQLDAEDDVVRLSPGVALAFRCTDRGSPCGSLDLAIDDPVVASAQPAFSDDLRYSPDDRTEVPEATFVVVAHAPGRTRLHVAGSTYQVVVE